VIADIDWPILREAYESRRPQPLLSYMSSGDTSQNIEGSNEDVSLDIAALAPEKRRTAIEGTVRGAVAGALGLKSADAIDAGMSLFKMGLDSLMALQVQRRLERALGGMLPAALVFNHPTVSGLVDLVDKAIEDRLGFSGDEEDVGELLARVDHLSGEEVDALLSKMLVEGGAG
jgi:acyl carrier protein